MIGRPNGKPPGLEQLRRELFQLANESGDRPNDWALRSALQRLLAAYEKEKSQAFAMGLLIGAILVIFLFAVR